MPDELMIPLRLLPPGRRRPGVISVTVPSRGRAAKLTASMQSLLNTAKRPDKIEFLVAHDPDDPSTAVAAFGMNADVIWEAPERYGYARSAHLLGGAAQRVNRRMGPAHLVRRTRTMTTEGWDDLLRAQPAGSVAFLDGNYPGLTCFPAVHADALSAVGQARAAARPGYLVGVRGPRRGGPGPPGDLRAPGPPRPDWVHLGPDPRRGRGRVACGFWRNRHPGVLCRAVHDVADCGHAGAASAAGLEDVYQARLAVWSDIQEQAPLLRDAARWYVKR